MTQRLDLDEIRKIFIYHPPTPKRAKIHEEIRNEMIQCVASIGSKIPHSRERSVFITKCQEAMMFANAALAIHGEKD